MATKISVTSSDTNGYKPSYIPAAIAALLVFILYLLTLAPSTAMWDTSEYIAAAYSLGHSAPARQSVLRAARARLRVAADPGGVRARDQHPGGGVQRRSAGMWFLITERVLAGWFAERWQRLVGAALAALIGATAFTVWNQSVVNEKVYTVSLAVLRGRLVADGPLVRRPDGPTADRLLVLVAYPARPRLRQPSGRLSRRARRRRRGARACAGGRSFAGARSAGARRAAVSGIDAVRSTSRFAPRTFRDQRGRADRVRTSSRSSCTFAELTYER